MKAFVDPDLCIGCTQCTGICPDVFQMTGILAVAVPGELPPDTVPTAVEAAQACPVSAITISESHLHLPSQHGRAFLFFLQKSPAGPHFVLYYKLSYNAMEETDYAFTGH